MSNTVHAQTPASSSEGGTGPASRPSVTRSGVIDAKHEGHRRYTIIDKQDAEIVRTAADLLDGSRLKDNHDLRVANLTGVFKRVAAWAEEHRDLLVAAYLTTQSRRVTLFFVSSAPRYDVQLDEQMTNLEVQLGGSAGVGSVETFQISEPSFEQFVGADALLLWKR